MKSCTSVLGQFINKAYNYDIYDRLISESEPVVYDGTPTQWTETEYDEYGRVKKNTSFTGKITNITYNGLITTVNDGTKTVTTTKNALGNVVSVQDPGGNINYTYYANGNLKSSDFEGSAQQIVQDGWGRKTQLTDPSAGLYTYAYNDFGETTQETTPKGATTYTYDAVGKLLSKHIQGETAAMSQTYNYIYNGTTKLLESFSLSNTDGNNAAYTYTYDSYKRLSNTTEDNLHARFSKTFVYDLYGRISTETSEAKNKANNKIVSKVLLNNYQNGGLFNITDNTTGEVIWQLNAVNARGQVTTALLGSTMKQTNTYDQYGFAQELKTERLGGNPAILMSLGYDFNPQRGNLNSRSNSVFGSNETFIHDSQDRLTNFNYNSIAQSHTYDTRGRITNNSNLGNYVYSASSYQQTGLNTLPTPAATYYLDRPLQQITYNAFKSPVDISEQGKEKISFQYNAALQRAHMYYGDENAEKMNRRYRRHYSEDGSMEITNDQQTGTTSFVFYMGGDAYSAPAIWKEVHPGNSQPLTANLYYLHRDHLGSINLITDNQGNIVEKRQFDAWGNLVKLEDGLGNPLTAFVILDRGYTGHEHLLGVALIHMNGRLYDPMLHRFIQPDNYVQDPYNSQNFNRYGYVLNNPLSHIDPSGEFIHIIIGAVVGGAINLTVKAVQGKIGSFKDGIAAFGIGAVAGGLGAATGGASLAASGLAGASVAGGALAGAAGAAIASPLQGLGNMAYFGDKYSLKQWGKDILFGGLAGGVIGGATAYFKGNNVWLGDPIGNGRNAFSFNNSDKWTFKAGEATAIFENSGNIYKNGEYAGNANNEVRSIVKYEPYPADDGFLGGYSESTNMRPGTVINRYGEEYGKYFSNTNGTVDNLSLPSSNNGSLTQYRVIRSFPVRGGIAAPYYGKPGGGVQFLSERTIEWLRINKYIEKLP